MPSVSVIVPVRNESRSIERTLRLLLTQDFPSDEFEVIVSDGVSTDDTVPIVRRLQGEFANLKLVFNHAKLSSAGRNTAVRHATKDVVVIVDGHCHVPDRDYLKNLSAAFEASGADSLGRPQPLDIDDPTPFQRAVSISRSSRLGHNPDSDIYSDEAKFVPPQSTAVAYSRRVFATIGLFDQEFDACEDVEFNERVHAADLTCYFTPTVKIVYEPRASFRALFYQLGRYGGGRAKLAFKHPKSLSIPALVPPLWALWAIFGAMLTFCSLFLGIVWLASLALYACVLLGAGVMLGRGQPAAVAARIPVVFVAIHFGFAWGFWKEVAKCVRHSIHCRTRRALPPTRQDIMKLLAASVLLALMTVSLRAEDDPKKALESLQGEWKVVEFIRDGNADKRAGTIAFDGSKMSIAAEKKTESMTISLDPKANPPAMDIKVSEGGKDLTIKAIYKLEKDKLSICFALDGKERPKEFKSEKDSKHGLFVLERAKK